MSPGDPTPFTRSMADPKTTSGTTDRPVRLDQANEDFDTHSLPEGWSGPPGQVWGEAAPSARQPANLFARTPGAGNGNWLPALVFGIGSFGFLIGITAALTIGGLNAILLIVSSLTVLAASIVMASGHGSGTTILKQEQEEIR